MTGAIIICADYRMNNGRFIPFEHIAGTSLIKYIIDHLRKEEIGYIVAVTGFRSSELERHLRDEGVNFVADEHYYSTSYIDKLRLGVGSLLSTLDEAVVVNITGQYEKNHLPKAFCIGKRCFENIIFDPDDQGVESVLIKELSPLELDIPESRLSDAPVYIRFDDMDVDCELINLLELIDDSGSLSQAASAMGISYSKAWNRLRDYSLLLEKKSGGRDGGGSRLSPYARDLLKSYKLMQKELDTRLDQLFEKHFTI